MASNAISPMQVQTWVEKYSKEYGVDPKFSNAVLMKESGGDVNAISRKGALGGMQVMPSTFKEMLPDGDINNPEDKIKAGIKYLSVLHKQTGGNYADTLGAYNAGPTGYANMKKNGAYAKETIGYVNDPRFSPWVGDQTIQSIANPMKGQSNANKFTPEQLNRSALKNSTNEAEANSQAASMQPQADVTSPLVKTQQEYKNILNQQQVQADLAEQERKKRAYQNLGMMFITGLLAPKQDNTTTNIGFTIPDSGGTRQQLQGYGNKNLANFQITGKGA